MRTANLLAGLTGLLVAAALAACPSKQTPTGDGTGDGTGTADGTDSVGNSRGTVADGACTSDDDCVVSCLVAGECCGQLCAPCGQVYTRAELAELEAWIGASCAAASCPVARCMAPDHDNVARCQDGACVIEAAPVAY